MFDFFEDGDVPDQRNFGTITDIRDLALVIFGRFLCRLDKQPPGYYDAKTCTSFLSVQETENILRDNSQMRHDGLYAVGGETPQEANENFRKLIHALLTRIMSNVLREGVSRELLNCEFDPEKNDFQFGITEKGEQLVKSLEDETDG